ncbi:MAG TPA: peroxiredoxin family protein [Pyrinomonadaceae bacterium]|nr:peroxiredoxin family protein [Pyrinomonadaceae bacterium]
MSVGDMMPELLLADEKGKDWRLSEHMGKVVVLLFYPQNETLMCTKQLCSLRDRWGDYLETKAEIVGISPAEPDEHAEFAKKYRLPIRLLADQGRAATRAYAKHPIYPVSFTRAVIVVDAEGRVRARHVMLRAFRPNDDDVIAAIYAARGDHLDKKYARVRSKIRGMLLR